MIFTKKDVRWLRSLAFLDTPQVGGVRVMRAGASPVETQQQCKLVCDSNLFCTGRGEFMTVQSATSNLCLENVFLSWYTISDMKRGVSRRWDTATGGSAGFLNLKYKNQQWEHSISQYLPALFTVTGTEWDLILTG